MMPVLVIIVFSFEYSMSPSFRLLHVPRAFQELAKRLFFPFSVAHRYPKLKDVWSSDLPPFL